MATRNEEVFQRMRRELEQSPAPGSRELYALAQELDPSIAQDSMRQFHARYVLPIMREQARERGGATPRRTRVRRTREPERAPAARRSPRSAPAPSAPARQDRDQIRAVLLEFARDFADADSRTEIVGVLSRIDEYVEKIAGTAHS